MRILRIQGRGFRSRFFETGSMAGLMRIFGRHYGFMTNFRIYGPESRLIEPGTGAGAIGCAEGPTGAWSALWGHGAP